MLEPGVVACLYIEYFQRLRQEDHSSKPGLGNSAHQQDIFKKNIWSRALGVIQGKGSEFRSCYPRKTNKYNWNCFTYLNVLCTCFLKGCSTAHFLEKIKLGKNLKSGSIEIHQERCVPCSEEGSWERGAAEVGEPGLASASVLHCQVKAADFTERHTVPTGNSHGTVKVLNSSSAL